MNNIPQFFLSCVHVALTMIATGLLASGSAHAEPLKPNPAKAKQARAEAEQLVQQADQISESYRDHQPGRIRDAAERVVGTYRDVAAAQLKMAEAYDKGAADAIAAALKDLQRAEAAVRRAQELHSTVNYVERYNSTDQTRVWLEQTVEAARPQLDAFLNSRNEAANAAAALANALEADADAEILTPLRDAWVTAQRNVDFHESAWSKANHVAYFARKAADEKDAARLAKFTRLQQLDAEIFQLLKQDSEVKTQLLQAQRRKQQAEAKLASLLPSGKKLKSSETQEGLAPILPPRRSAAP